MTPNDLTFQIRTHLLYELRWMIYAATEFKKGNNKNYVALIDSAIIHARNLLEFAELNKTRSFTLRALGGTSSINADWKKFLNNRVTHMYGREANRPTWPSGLDNSRPDKLTVMAGEVLNTLESDGMTIPTGSVRDAYYEVLLAAKNFLVNPSEETHKNLAVLYDSSRDSRPY